METKTITGAELAKHAGISPAYVSRLLKNNLIPHTIIGKNRYPLRSCVDIMDRKCDGDFCLEIARDIVGYSISDAIAWATRINADFLDNCWWVNFTQISDEVNRLHELKIKKNTKPARRIPK